MMRPQLTRNSSLCRSRRSLMSSQSSSMLSQDPDLLSMTSTPLSYHPEQDEDRLYFSSDRRYGTPPPPPGGLWAPDSFLLSV